MSGPPIKPLPALNIKAPLASGIAKPGGFSVPSIQSPSNPVANPTLHPGAPTTAPLPAAAPPAAAPPAAPAVTAPPAAAPPTNTPAPAGTPGATPQAQPEDAASAQQASSSEAKDYVPQFGSHATPGKPFAPPINSLRFAEQLSKIADDLSGSTKTYTYHHILPIGDFPYFSIEELRYFDYISQKVVDPPVYPPPPTVKASALMAGGATTTEAAKTTTGLFGQTGAATKPPDLKWDNIEFPQIDKFDVPTAERFFIPSSHILHPQRSSDLKETSKVSSTAEISKIYTTLFEPPTTSEPKTPIAPLSIDSRNLRCARPQGSITEKVLEIEIQRGQFKNLDRLRLKRDGIGMIDFISASDLSKVDADREMILNECFLDLPKSNRAEKSRLSREAIVTFFHAWPADENGVRRPCDGLTEYEDILKQYTEENGYNFLNYDPKEGKFQFKVPNFDRAPIKLP